VGYGWDTSRVTLHAISRDESAFPLPCLYCQVDSDEVSEIRFVPSDPEQLQAIFDAFSKSAELNPDDDDDEDGEGDDDGWVFDEDEVANGARAAEIAAHLDAVLTVSPSLRAPHVAGQFDDADEADELL
jgi:nucleotide-sensitive chloride channel 1A